MSTSHQLTVKRLGGEACPRDLQLLADHCEPLLTDRGVRFGVEADWAPWADKSYLTDEDYANPDIAANVKAIDETCALVRFIAELDGGECIGYWVGPQARPIEECSVVYYDTEGQFTLCGGRFVESLFHLIYDDEALAELRLQCSRLGIPLNFETLDDIPIPPSVVAPDVFHNQRYEEHLKAEHGGRGERSSADAQERPSP